MLTGCVALRKESVDRNEKVGKPWGLDRGSLSARRAWIEIHQGRSALVEGVVALRKESVDRNQDRCFEKVGKPVALRKESVDRNFDGRGGLSAFQGRSPQGERG